MNILLYRISSIAASLLFAGVSFAQQSAPEQTGTISMSVQRVERPQTSTLHVSAPWPNPSILTGAPYCAQVAIEQIQTLADGTHITHKSQSTKRCRDSEGRTRQESSPGGAQIVEIQDPVSGFRYLLDVQNRVAHRFAPAVEKTVDSATHLQSAPAAAAANSNAEKKGPGTQPPPVRAETTSESLGTQVVEGVLVEGTKNDDDFSGRDNGQRQAHRARDGVLAFT